MLCEGMIEIIVLIIITRPHRIHNMWTIANDYLGRLSVGLGFTVQTRLNGSRYYFGWRLFVLDGSLNFPNEFDVAFTKLLWPLG